MAVAEPVTVKRDLFDPKTGTRIATKGDPGTVTGFSLTPGTPGLIPAQRQLLFNVLFNLNGSNVLARLQKDLDFLFRNGDEGLLNVILSGASVVPNGIQKSTPDGTDLQVQSAFPAQFPVGYRIKFSNGLGVLFLSDRNLGVTRVELDAF